MNGVNNNIFNDLWSSLMPVLQSAMDASSTVLTGTGSFFNEKFLNLWAYGPSLSADITHITHMIGEKAIVLAETINNSPFYQGALVAGAVGIYSLNYVRSSFLAKRENSKAYAELKMNVHNKIINSHSDEIVDFMGINKQMIEVVSFAKKHNIKDPEFEQFLKLMEIVGSINAKDIPGARETIEKELSQSSLMVSTLFSLYMRFNKRSLVLADGDAEVQLSQRSSRGNPAGGAWSSLGSNNNGNQGVRAGSGFKSQPGSISRQNFSPPQSIKLGEDLEENEGEEAQPEVRSLAVSDLGHLTEDVGLSSGATQVDQKDTGITPVDESLSQSGSIPPNAETPENTRSTSHRKLPNTRANTNLRKVIRMIKSLTTLTPTTSSKRLTTNTPVASGKGKRGRNGDSTFSPKDSQANEQRLSPGMPGSPSFLPPLPPPLTASIIDQTLLDFSSFPPPLDATRVSNVGLPVPPPSYELPASIIDQTQLEFSSLPPPPEEKEENTSPPQGPSSSNQPASVGAVQNGSNRHSSEGQMTTGAEMQKSFEQGMHKALKLVGTDGIRQQPRTEMDNQLLQAALREKLQGRRQAVGDSQLDSSEMGHSEPSVSNSTNGKPRSQIARSLLGLNRREPDGSQQSPITIVRRDPSSQSLGGQDLFQAMGTGRGANMLQQVQQENPQGTTVYNGKDLTDSWATPNWPESIG